MCTKKNNLHCINVPKVYDWVARPIDVQILKIIKGQKTLVTDCVSGNIAIECGQTTLLWKASSRLSVSGTITLSHMSGCKEMEVIVNGNLVFTLSSGQSRSMTFLQLQSVEVRCLNGHELCLGKYCLHLHYPLGAFSCMTDDCRLACFLSDQDGNPIDSIECKEIPQKQGRKNVETLLPNNKNITLQKVKMVKKGFITIKIICREKTTLLCTIPFCLFETFYLCAPPGTSVECQIFDFHCESCLIPDFKKCERKQLSVNIHFCQEVQVIHDVNIGLRGKECHPRPCISNSFWKIQS